MMNVETINKKELNTEKLKHFLIDEIKKTLKAAFDEKSNSDKIKDDFSLKIGKAIADGIDEWIKGAVKPTEIDASEIEDSVKEIQKEIVEYVERRWDDVTQTMQMLQNSMLGFSEGINPITIQTMQIAVGDESLQFRFVDSKVNPKTVDHIVTYNGQDKTLTAAQGIIQHMTMGITEIKAVHTDDEYMFWDVRGFTSRVLESTKPYYLYIRADKTSSDADFVLSEIAIPLEWSVGYYHFLTGILNSEYENTRAFVTLYGFTEILPGRITTKRIVSPDGSTYFDLENNEIGGNIKFKSGSTYTDIGIGIAGAVGEAQGYTDAVKAGLQAQIDGVIDSWFYDYSPTTSNYPASDWTTTELKQRHVGDTFTNTQPFVDNDKTPDAGKSWRWVENAGVFSWTQIADSDAVLALQRAAQAQDTADGKRRVFTTQPVTPYNVGDLWSQGSAGDLMRCKTERLTGSYNSADWEKASKYTDDTAANAAQTAANNAAIAATAANTMLTEWAEDSVLDPSEKQSVKLKWNEIVEEKPKNVTQAGIYGVDAAPYNDAYDILYDYVVTQGLLADLTTASTIVRADFTYAFSNYYTSRQTLLNAIAQAAKTFVGTSINGLQVGGENIADRTEIAIVAGSENSRFDFIKGNLSSTPVSGSYLKNNQAHVLTISDSIRTAGTATHYSVVLFDFTQGLNTYQQEFAFSSSKRVIKFTTPATGNWSLLVYAGVAGATAGNSVEYKGIMLQEGNKETAYQSAVKYLTQAIEGSTEIAGGLVATNLLMMKDSENIRVRAGLSGLADDNIAFWGGGTYQNALDGLANVIIRKDSSSKFGDIIITKDGKIEMNSINNTKQLNIIRGNSPLLSSLLSSSYTYISLSNSSPLSASRNFTNPQQSGFTAAVSNSGSFTVTDTVRVFMQFYATYNYSPNIPQPRYNEIIVRLINNTTSNIFEFRSSTTGLTIDTEIPPGNYDIEVSAYAGISSQIINTGGLGVVLTWDNNNNKYQSVLNRTILGSDGIMVVKDKNKHFVLSQEESTFLKVKGSTDMPGVLLAGDGASGGGGTIRFGAKRHATNTVERLAETGKYRVWHSIGHSKYTVQLTMKDSGLNAMWGNPQNSYFDVWIYSGTTPAYARFSFVVFGDN